MNSILCIDASPSYCATLSELASDSGLNAVLCHDAEQACRQLDGTESFILMIVSDDIADDEAGMRLLQHARQKASRATMPIAYVIKNRDLELARAAFQAGATEVVLRSDDEMIRHFILEAANSVQKSLQAGRVLLVEDENCQAEHLREICLMQGLTVDRCISMEEGVECLQRADYQIAIIDILLKGLNSGLMLVRHIRQLPPPRSLMPILVISGFDDAARRIEALRIGADDFLAKPFAEEEFLWRLQKISQPRVNQEAEIPRAALADLSSWQQHGLSSRESEICEALIRGLNDKQIAHDLNISFWTVRSHITKIFTKLGVLNRRELMARHLPSLGN
ncbi:MAG: DNA-binding response regulator [Azonexus sp.]